MADRPVFLYVAAYDDYAEAEVDFESVFDLHAAGAIGTFDAAIISKEDGKVHVHKVEKPTQHGAWTGIAAGAVLGIIFPPSVIGTAAAGGLAGGVIGHLRKGMSRSDLRDVGETLEEGEAGIIVIGESKIEEQIERAAKHARRLVEKEIDAEADELKREIENADVGEAA